MTDFKRFIDCDNNSIENINIEDILQHPQSPFAILSPAQLEQYQINYATGNKKEIVVRAREPTENYAFEHYEALCCYGLIQKQKRLGNDTCQCYVKRDLSNDEALVEMLVNTLKQSSYLSLSEKAKAYELLHQAVSCEAYKLVGECEGSFHKVRGLTQLITPFIPLVEEKKMSMQAAAQIFTLDKGTQKVIYNYLLTCNKKLTLPIAIALKRYATEIGEITPSTLTTIFGGTG